MYEITREITKSKTGYYPSDTRDIISNFDNQLNDIGIFSLSETAENQLMWSHYADENRGIAIGFEIVDKSKLADSKHCLKVNYSNDLPSFSVDGFISELSFSFDANMNPIALQKISFDDPTFKLAIKTKPTCWEYEKEWRYIEVKSGSYSFPGRITELVFGLLCSIENREKYKYLINKFISNSVKFFEIQKVPNSNSIIKVEI